MTLADVTLTATQGAAFSATIAIGGTLEGAAHGGVQIGDKQAEFDCALEGGNITIALSTGVVEDLAADADDDIAGRYSVFHALPGDEPEEVRRGTFRIRKRWGPSW